MTDLTAAQMVDKLRTFRQHYSPIALYTLMDDAATLIEQQAEQIAGLAYDRDGYKDACKMYEQPRDASDSRAEQANAEAAALRKDLNASVAMHEQARLLANSALDERDLLRKVIEDAPHTWECGHANRIVKGCTCWKSKALADEETGN